MIFMQGIVKCEACSKTQMMYPEISSGWTAMQIEDKLTYFCPGCFGNSRITKECKKCYNWHQSASNLCPYCKLNKGFGSKV